MNITEKGIMVEPRFRSTLSKLPLHEAASKFDAKELRSGLKQIGINPNERDGNGRTALHVLLCDEFSGHLFQPEMEECLNILIEDDRCDINARDNEHECPLSLAVRHGFESAALALVREPELPRLRRKGADTTILTKSFPKNHSLASAIAATMPKVMMEILDSGIVHNGEQGQLAEVSLDWSKILQYPSKDASSFHQPKSKFRLKENRPRETSFLYSLLDNPISTRGPYLKHPLVSSYLHLRLGLILNWKGFLLYAHQIPAILILIGYQVLVYAFYFGTCAAQDDKTSDNSTESDVAALVPPTKPMAQAPPNDSTIRDCESNLAMAITSGILFLLVIVVGLVDIYMILQLDMYYLKSWRTMLTRASYCLMGITLLGPILVEIDKSSDISWIYPIAALGIFFGYVIFILQAELTIPQVRTYLEMMAVVVMSVIRIILLFLLLFVGFYEGFRLMYGEPQSLADFFSIALDVSSVSEEYENIDEAKEKASARFLFSLFSHSFRVMFMVIVGIVFINFLLGVTISDIQGLRRNAEVMSLSHRVQGVYLTNRFSPRRFKVVSEEDAQAGNWTYKFQPSNAECPKRNKFSEQILKEITQFLKIKKYPMLGDERKHSEAEGESQN